MWFAADLTRALRVWAAIPASTPCGWLYGDAKESARCVRAGLSRSVETTRSADGRRVRLAGALREAAPVTKGAAEVRTAFRAQPWPRVTPDEPDVVDGSARALPRGYGMTRRTLSRLPYIARSTEGA
jgi:hypothetical protein